MKNKNGYAQKSAVQTKALESLQRRALCIIYEDGDYVIANQSRVRHAALSVLLLSARAVTYGCGHFK